MAGELKDVPKEFQVSQWNELGRRHGRRACDAVAVAAHCVAYTLRLISRSTAEAFARVLSTMFQSSFSDAGWLMVVVSWEMLRGTKSQNTGNREECGAFPCSLLSWCAACVVRHHCRWNLSTSYPVSLLSARRIQHAPFLAHVRHTTAVFVVVASLTSLNVHPDQSMTNRESINDESMCAVVSVQLSSSSLWVASPIDASIFPFCRMYIFHVFLRTRMVNSSGLSVYTYMNEATGRRLTRLTHTWPCLVLYSSF